MIEVKAICTCDKCGYVEEKQINIKDNNKPEEIYAPMGWTYFRHMLLCPRHTLKKVTLIDGEEVQ